MKPKNASTKKHSLKFNAESRHRLPDDCSLSYDQESGLFTVSIPLGLNSKECDVLSILSGLGGYKYAESGLAVNVSVAINKKKLSEWAEANGVDLGE